MFSGVARYLERRHLLIALSIQIIVMLSSADVFAGLYDPETFNNHSYQQMFDDPAHKVFGTLSSVCSISLDGDPMPNVNLMFNKTIFTLDAGFQKTLWNYYNPSNEKYSIYGYVDDPGLKFAKAITSNTAGDIYIADTGNHRILQLKGSFGGNGLRVDKVREIGGLGRTAGTFISPYDVSIHGGDNHVFVLDYGNSRFQEFDVAGNHVLTFGSYGSNPGQFIHPKGIACGPNDYIYISDTGNKRIQKLRKVGNSYQVYRQAIVSGELSDIALGNGGAVYVVDLSSNEIHLFDRDLNYITAYRGNPGDPFRNLRGISVSNPYGGNLASTSLVSVESDRITQFQIGMEVIDVHTEPDHFYPLGSENTYTTLKYTLTEQGKVKLYVYNSQNKKVRTFFVDKSHGLGLHEQVWDGKDDAGKICPGGRYSFELVAFDTNANGHAIEWVYKPCPVTIHEAPKVTIHSVSPTAFYSDGPPAVVSYSLSKPGFVQTDVYYSDNTWVRQYVENKVAGEHAIAWNGLNFQGLKPIDGYYTIKIKAKNTDDQGREYWGVEKSIQVGLANNPPEVELYTPSHGIYGINATINGRMEGFIISGYRLEYSIAGEQIWNLLMETSLSAGKNGELASWNTSGLERYEDKEYKIRLTAWNQAGRLSQTQRTVTIDNIAPRINSLQIFPEYISPVYASTGSTQNATSVDYEVEDFQWATSELIFLDKHLSERKVISLPARSGTASWDGYDDGMLELPDGRVTCRIVVRDKGGNESTLDRQMMIDTNRYPESINVVSTTQLTGQLNSNVKICWHPDSERVAYTSAQNGCFVHLANADGSGSQILQSASSNVVSRPDIRPDGKLFLFDYQSQQTMYLRNMPDQPYYYERVSTNAIYGNYSPDGSRIAFKRAGSTQYEIWVMDADGQNQEYLANGHYPSWSPDGEQVLYCTDIAPIPPYQSDIYAVSVADKTITGPLVTNAMYPEYSPDGNVLIYLNSDYSFSVRTADGGGFILIWTPQAMRMATWSQDGEKLAYVTEAGETYVAALAGPLCQSHGCAARASGRG